MTSPANPTKTISRSQAKAWTLGAQLASVVFVLGALGLGVLGLPEPTIGPSIDPTNNPGNPFGDLNAQPIDSTNPGANALRSNQIDTLGLAQRFSLLDNAPTIPEPTPISKDPQPEPVPDSTDNEIAKRVRYIGFINDPDTRHAFIRIDGKQRIVSLGQIAKAGAPEFSDLTVERITPKHIVMSDGDNRAQILLATRTGQSITLIGGGEVEVAAVAQKGSALTAEDEATILALPPRQQPRARRRLERERRGLSPDKEYRSPVREPLGTARGNLNRNRQNRND